MISKVGLKQKITTSNNKLEKCKKEELFTLEKCKKEELFTLEKCKKSYFFYWKSVFYLVFVLVLEKLSQVKTTNGAMHFPM